MSLLIFQTATLVLQWFNHLRIRMQRLRAPSLPTSRSRILQSSSPKDSNKVGAEKFTAVTDMFSTIRPITPDAPHHSGRPN